MQAICNACESTFCILVAIQAFKHNTFCENVDFIKIFNFYSFDFLLFSQNHHKFLKNIKKHLPNKKSSAIMKAQKHGGILK